MTLASEEGVVLRGTGGVWVVRTVAGVEREVSLRGRLKQDNAPKLAVGDRVTIEPAERGDGWAIGEIHARTSSLSRRAPGMRQAERVVAANVDQVVVVFAVVKPEPHPRMLDRFLTIAEANDLSARIVINKVDLASEASARQRFAAYERAGYPIHYTSTKEPRGLDALRDALHDRTSVFTGPSGVGTLTLPPSTASLSVTGRFSRMFVPSRVKNEWGAISMVTMASPRPAGPSSPFPPSLILVPSSNPWGSLRSMVLPSASVIRCGFRATASTNGILSR